MQLTSSLSAFNGENDFNYFIETTQNMPIQSKQSDNHVFNYSYEYNIHDQKPIHDYIAKLEKKIIIQTKKLSELEKYKYKCEQFIKKTNPYQILPITDEMLSNNYEIIKDPINAAEQRNYIDLLKKTIENELIKNGLLNQNIKVEEIIDFAKIKLENEECKKQLVLAHSMINSLKSDLVELTKENEEYKMNKDKNLSIKNNESINMNQNLKAVVFARVSTREQEEGYSIEGQLNRIKQYCERKQLPILATYTIAESSNKGGRKKFYEMLNFVKKQKVPIAIVCDKVDRLQRSFEEYPVLIDMVRRHNTQLHFVTEHEVINKNSNGHEFTKYQINIVLSESYTNNMSDNIVKNKEEDKENKGNIVFKILTNDGISKIKSIY